MHGIQNAKFESSSAPLENLKTHNVNIPFKKWINFGQNETIDQTESKISWTFNSCLLKEAGPAQTFSCHLMIQTWLALSLCPCAEEWQTVRVSKAC